MTRTVSRIALRTAHDGSTIIRRSASTCIDTMYKNDTLYLYYDTTDANNDQGWVVSYELPIQAARYDTSVEEHDGYGAYTTTEHRLSLGRVDNRNPRRISARTRAPWHTPVQRASIYCPTLTDRDKNTVYTIHLVKTRRHSYIATDNVYLPGFGILTDTNTGYDRYDRHRPTLSTIEEHPVIQKYDTVLGTIALLSFVIAGTLVALAMTIAVIATLMSPDGTSLILKNGLHLKDVLQLLSIIAGLAMGVSVGAFSLYGVIVAIPYVYQRRRWNRKLAQLPPLTNTNDIAIDDDTYGDIGRLCAVMCAHDHAAHTDTTTPIYDAIDDIIAAQRHTDIINALTDPNHSDHDQIDAAAMATCADAYTHRARRYDSHQAIDQLISRLTAKRPMTE